MGTFENLIGTGYVWALLPFALGLVCLFGAVARRKSGKSKRTIILTVGGLAMIVVGWTFWNRL